MRSSLHMLKMTKKCNWEYSDVEIVVELYKTGSQRQQKAFDDLDLMERGIKERIITEKIR